MVSAEQQDERQQAVVFDHLGQLSLKQNQLLKAEKYYNDSLRIYKKLKEPKGEATVLNQLGFVYYYSKQWDKAEQFCRDGASLSEQFENYEVMSSSWQCLGRICLATGRTDEAEKWLNKANDYYRKVEDKAKEMETMLILSDLYIYNDTLED